MVLDVITFEKSLDKRFEENWILFGNEEKPLCASEIKNVWCDLVELMLEPSGWQALWKVSRLTCAEYGIQFPSLIFVMVNKVIPSSLSAVVNILAVQDDIHLPEVHVVPLIHLLPTVQQEDNSLLLTHTADCLDQMRYFYNHLWRPWDEDDHGNNTDFKFRLEQRFCMYRDMQNGTLNQMEVEYIKMLLNKINNLTEKIKALEEGTFANDSVFVVDEDDSLECELIDLHFLLHEAKLEMEALENPQTRKLYLQKKLDPIAKQKEKVSKEVFFIWPGGPYDELLGALFEAKKFLPEDAFVKPSTLPEAIQEAVTGDTILLCPGVHSTDGKGKFSKDCTIKGYPQDQQNQACILACGQQDDALLDWDSTTLHLEDITLRDDQLRTLGIVRQGVLRLRNCVLEASSRRNTDGILVLDNGRVELDNCQFIGLRVAIIAHPGAAVSMNNCKIRSCEFGIQASEKSCLSMKDCNITKCASYGLEIRRIKQTEDLQNETGSVELLAKIHIGIVDC
ncbi:protein nessun dorma isoform X2 [Anabrus simplex]|uniref:protein nessun dorma isoform X2 n=1 Tax=Anabrus simplex TaxID=316456 RepID=UPI0035A34944